MAVAHKGAISFGLVYIPVELYTATQNNDIRFNQLAKDNLARVRYIKTCKGCKKELGPQDIVKGFQYDKDKYVVVSDEDFDKIKTEKDRSIKIVQFADISAIPPVYFDKSYQVIPSNGGEKAFELLRLAMQQEKKVAIGRTVLGNSETVVVLMPTEDGLLLETLFYQDEIKDIPKAKPAAKPKVEEGELTMARELIGTMEKPFRPEEFHDEYQQKLRDLIQTKIEGKEVVSEPAAKPDNVINLMDALQQSLKQTGGAAGGKKTTAKKAAGKPRSAAKKTSTARKKSG